jgi:hypothetical protein
VIVSLVILRIVRFHCLFLCKSWFPGLLSLSSCLIIVLSLLFPFSELHNILNWSLVSSKCPYEYFDLVGFQQWIFFFNSHFCEFSRS